MGCLNDAGQFSHWFGNIHLSGPCNRACYFCIGQHMMALDSFNTLDTFPLPGWSDFADTCKTRRVGVVYLTGTNTDPLLCRRLQDLRAVVKTDLRAKFGVRTNAVAHLDALRFFDTGSVTICSLSPVVYPKMMGRGTPPDVRSVLQATAHFSPSLKVNIVLGPENVETGDLWHTLDALGDAGVKRVNLREPYGQPRVGNPMILDPVKNTFGMPTYDYDGLEVTYWDVHYVEVESVNLYASGRVSENYPITLGHAPTGEVHPQRDFPGGRIREQWLSTPPSPGEEQ